MQKIIKSSIILIIGLTLASCTTFSTGFHSPQNMVKKYNYFRYIPKTKPNDAPLPILVFLHGSGERGNDIEKVKIHGPLRLIKEGRDLPFIIIAPQSEADTNWKTDRLDKTLKDATKYINYDASRIYVTGLSRGGQATWNWAIAHPDLFAAIIPISGWSNIGESCELKNMPIWAFHGEADKVVSVIHTIEMTDWIKKCGGSPKITLYPNVNHDAWTQTYYTQEIYDWLLRHSNPNGKNAIKKLR